MKPAPFKYLRPESVAEALRFLDDYGMDGKVLAGGQSLIPLLNMRLAKPLYLIDLGKLDDLKYIREEGDYLAIGAMVRHAELECSQLIMEKCALLSEAVSLIGHVHIRNRGTIGGSIAHADPSAELVCVLSALRGEIVVANGDGKRTVSPEDFFLTYLMTAIDVNEILTEVRFPKLPVKSGSAFSEFTRRNGDFALVSAAAVVALEESGEISFIRLCLGGVGAVPFVCEEAENGLIGQLPSENIFREVSEFVKKELQPEADVHASAEYRKQLAGSLLQRSLLLATERATQKMKERI